MRSNSFCFQLFALLLCVSGSVFVFHLFSSRASYSRECVCVAASIMQCALCVLRQLNITQSQYKNCARLLFVFCACVCVLCYVRSCFECCSFDVFSHLFVFVYI